MTKNEIAKYWVNSSEVDFLAMETLLNNGHYVWALFIGHLVIEKLLKAYYVRNVNTNVPRTHDLTKIAEKGNLVLSEEQKDLLDEVTTFNIKSRYPDYKMAHREDKKLIYQKIREYIQLLEENQIKIWRLYLYGSYARNSYDNESDIDLAVFLEKEDLDGFEEDAQLMKLRRKVDMRIEPHPFAKSDFDQTNPYIKEIVESGERII